jgi:8-oxo-dGTP pyrophosphatase MutT (NUDIX family)
MVGGDAGLYKRMTRSVVFSSPWCRLVAESSHGEEPYYFVEVDDYVTVIARTVGGTFLLVRQHRPVTGGPCIELPSGHVDPGETPEQAGRRELLEETGMIAGAMELLGVLVPDVGRIRNRMWCYFAADVVCATGAVRETGIDVLEVGEPALLAMATDGRIEHALNLSALFLAVRHGRVRSHPE